MSAKPEARAAALLVALLLAGCQRGGEAANPLLENPAAVTDQRLLAAPADGSQWIIQGGGYSGQHYSRLSQIDASNVGQLKLALRAGLGASAGQAEPLFIDGIIYVPVNGRGVLALDAASGARLWQYDADAGVSGIPAQQACCDAAGRGIAAWQGRLYMATPDARLVAIDARNGRQVWSSTAQAQASISMAPLIAQGKVFIGATVAGGRSWIAAFDADTGRELWRFHTVPGDPSIEPANEAMKRAATTWQAMWWKTAVGGAVRNAPVFDVSSGYIVLGVGAADSGAGTRLFTSSLVALKVDDGEYVWHFQSPDSGNTMATLPLMTMDVLLDGRPRHVLAQAGAASLLMLDVATGELLRDDRAAGDAGAPAPAPATVAGQPSGDAAAFSPATRLVYIASAGSLRAWNPVARSMAWETPRAGGAVAGGLLATAGGLVFSAVGDALQAQDARTGQLLWSWPAQNLTAPPISFERDGRQYIAVSAGNAEAAGAALLVFALGDAPELDDQKD